MARRGRGRLSSLETLPEHAEPEVAWALEALAERKLTQVEILIQLNARLAALQPPVGPVSKSAFGRFTLRFSAQARRLQEAREAAAAIAERLDDMPEGDVGLMLGETIKALINDVLLDRMVEGQPVGIGDLRAAAEAVQRLEMARKASHEVAATARRHAVVQAAQAVEAAGRARGLTADTVESIKREILGV